MSTANPNRFSPQVVAKQLSTLPAGATDLFVVTGGPIQIIELTGFVEVTIAGTAYVGHLQNDITSTTANYSSDLTLTGLTAGYMIDWWAPFDTPRTGVPLVVPYGSAGFYSAPGIIKFIPGGTPGAGCITFSLVYMPVVPGTIVTPA